MPFSATLVTREKRAVTWRVIGSKYFGLGLRDQWFQRLAALARESVRSEYRRRGFWLLPGVGFRRSSFVATNS